MAQMKGQANSWSWLFISYMKRVCSQTCMNTQCMYSRSTVPFPDKVLMSQLRFEQHLRIPIFDTYEARYEPSWFEVSSLFKTSIFLSQDLCL